MKSLAGEKKKQPEKLHFITVNYLIQPSYLKHSELFSEQTLFLQYKKNHFKSLSWRIQACNILSHLDNHLLVTGQEVTHLNNWHEYPTKAWPSEKVTSHQHMLEHLWWRLNHDLLDNQLLSVSSETDAFGRLWLNNLLVGLKCNWCVILGEKGHDHEKQYHDSQYHKQICCLYANFIWMYSIMMIYAGLELPNFHYTLLIFGGF